jgi:hypothetical protein
LDVWASNATLSETKADPRGAVVVAKKSPKRKPDDAPADPKADSRNWGKQPVLFQVRGRPEFKEAVLEMMEFEGIGTFSDLVDRALRAYGREIRYPKILPKR